MSSNDYVMDLFNLVWTRALTINESEKRKKPIERIRALSVAGMIAEYIDILLKGEDVTMPRPPTPSVPIPTYRGVPSPIVQDAPLTPRVNVKPWPAGVPEMKPER